MVLMAANALTQDAFARYARGDLTGTVAACQNILKLEGPSLVVLELQGIALAQQGHVGAAQAVLAQALGLAPANLSLLNNLAKLNFDAGNWRECLTYLRQIQRLTPLDEQLHARLSLTQDHLLHGAQTCLEQHRGQTTGPTDVNALLQSGNDFYGARRFEDALECYALAANLAPDHALAHANLGAAAQSLGETSLALAHYDQALALDSRHLPTWLNKGIALARINDNGQALACYEKALALAPEHADVHWNLSLTLLKTGNYEAGWQHYERRWQRSAYASLRPVSSQPLWLGQAALQGRSILLHAEQGLGDTLQFSRYIQQVQALGARVILQIQPALTELFSPLPGIEQVIPQGQPLPAHDYQCPLMSLPLAFQTRLDNIPSPLSSLQIDPQRVDAWQARLGPRRKPRVGLVWRGTAQHPDDHERSLDLGLLWRFLSPACDYISLQKDIPAADLPVLQRWPGILDTRTDLHSLADTAALIHCLDVVVSVDTSVAHLSATLGKPTWILLAHCPDWRWLLDRSDSPWYPSARLYRQASPGDWHAPLLAVRAGLQALQG